MPEGEMTTSWGKATNLMHLQFFLLVFLPLLWIYVNLPELSDLVLIYLIIAVFGTLIVLIERMSPKGTPWAVMGLNTENLGQQVLSAVFIAVVTIIVGGREGVVVPVRIPAETFMRIYLWGYALMAVEELLFTQVILATVEERLGIVPGALIAAVAFVAFHWRIYGWNFRILMAFALYRIVAGILSGVYKSVVPTSFPHLIINVLAAARFG